MRAAVALLLLLTVACRRSEPHYTGFVEGEERIVRSEVTGRVVDVPYREGDTVPAGAVVARLDDTDIRAKLTSKKRELDVVEADIATAEERVALTRSTWERNLAATQSDVEQAVTTAAVADRTLAREAELAKTGASTAQQLDDAVAARDQAASTLERAKQVLARTEAEERSIALARHELTQLRERRELLLAELAELEVTRAKYEIHSPAVGTVVQTQFIWPGELAQPGTSVLAVLDPIDKYVRVYVPVEESARLPVGQRVDIELDSRPDERIRGEISFIADKANFTPEKIETRRDRLGQVYRVKVRILEGAERFRPGTEGNVYPVDGTHG